MQKKPGFTMVEIMIVSAIVGMLVTIVLTQLSTVRIKARNTKAKLDIASLSQAVERFKSTERLSEVVVSANQAANAGAHPNATAAINNGYSCRDATGALATCLTNAMGLSAAQDTSFKGIFTGSEVVSDSSQNTYAVPAPKVAAAGYRYYYVTSDTSLTASADRRSSNSSYMVIADLGAVGGSIDAVSRYYYIRSGTAVTAATNPNLINGGTGGLPARATAFLPTFQLTVQN